MTRFMHRQLYSPVTLFHAARKTATLCATFCPCLRSDSRVLGRFVFSPLKAPSSLRVRQTSWKTPHWQPPKALTNPALPGPLMNGGFAFLVRSKKAGAQKSHCSGGRSRRLFLKPLTSILQKQNPACETRSLVTPPSPPQLHLSNSSILLLSLMLLRERRRMESLTVMSTKVLDDQRPNRPPRSF